VRYRLGDDIEAGRLKLGEHAREAEARDSGTAGGYSAATAAIRGFGALLRPAEKAAAGRASSGGSGGRPIMRQQPK
jgi:hypothetical protein